MLPAVATRHIREDEHGTRSVRNPRRILDGRHGGADAGAFRRDPAVHVLLGGLQQYHNRFAEGKFVFRGWLPRLDSNQE